MLYIIGFAIGVFIMAPPLALILLAGRRTTKKHVA